MRYINGGVGAASPVAPVLIASAFACGGATMFTACMTNESAFRVFDSLDGRLLDEGEGREGAASLLRRIHENVEMLVFTIGSFGWIAGAAVYEWNGTLRNWGSGPSMNMAGTLRIEVDQDRVSAVELHLNGEAYLDLVHDGRAPRPYDAAPGQARRAAL